MTSKHGLSAGEICQRVVSVAYPTLALEEAARVMRDQHVGSLVVVEEIAPDERMVVGMLTDRDIVTAVVARQQPVYGMSVGDVMSRDVVTVRERDSLLDVLATMRSKGVRRVPVVGPQRRLVGLCAIDDVLQQIAEQLQALATAAGAARQHENAASARP
ncbi:CBS domain-containing protein [Aquabacterium sp.]|uniref:CBS domain-containing protein n=1 Tax=Aquabacterium sp. TaxID=1872578 RepID=UPI0037845C4E